MRAAFSNPILDRLEDSAVLALGRERLAFTTDSYVVNPLFFPGGDIGALAVPGTVNDLTTAGAQALVLPMGLILEEGLPVELLRRVLDSMRAAAEAASVQIVTGDTKVVNHGSADQIFINTAGVGRIPTGVDLSPLNVQLGDRVLPSGPVGWRRCCRWRRRRAAGRIQRAVGRPQASTRLRAARKWGSPQRRRQFRCAERV